MSGADRRTLLAPALVGLALAIGLAVWIVELIRPSMDAELAAEGGVVLELELDLDGAIATTLWLEGRALRPASAVRVEPAPAPGEPPELLLRGDRTGPPGPGFLTPRLEQIDGASWVRWRLTPNQASAIRKRAFNQTAELLRRRFRHLPEGRARVVMPGGDRLHVEVTRAVPEAWRGALLERGVPGVALADGAPLDRADLERVVTDVDGVAVRPRAGRSGSPPVALTVDDVRRGGVEQALDDEDWRFVLSGTVDERLRTTMLLSHGPLPAPLSVAATRALSPVE